MDSSVNGMDGQVGSHLYLKTYVRYFHVKKNTRMEPCGVSMTLLIPQTIFERLLLISAIPSFTAALQQWGVGTIASYRWQLKRE